MFKRIQALLCGAILATVLPMAAQQQWDKTTKVTFNQPVALPGITLQPGTYLFKLADVAQYRHVIQVFNAEQTHIYATILAVPNYRLTPTKETVMRFAERPRNQPEALRAWFYPGDTFGQEFVYPKAKAAELAEVTHAPVLAASLEPEETKEELIKEPVVAVTPEKKEIEITQLTGPAPRAPVVAQATPPPARPEAPAELPTTASPLPMLILLGVGAGILGGTIRGFARRLV